MKILVTGASGLLGYELCEQLHKDHEVYAVDNHFRSDLIPNCAHWIKADLCSPLDLPIDFDYIYHMGAINGTDYFYSIPNQLLANNITADLNIFKFAEQCTNLKKLVYASSSEIVAGTDQFPTDEIVDINIKNIHNPRWCYMIGKIAAENYLANSTLPWLAIRYFNVYGKNSKPGHFVSDQITKIKNQVFELIGADETRCYCYVEDAMSATVKLAAICNNEVINVGSDIEITSRDAVQVIAQQLGVTATFRELPGRVGSGSRRKPDISKLRNYIDFDPISFEEGIKQIL